MHYIRYRNFMAAPFHQFDIQNVHHRVFLPNTLVTNTTLFWGGGGNYSIYVADQSMRSKPYLLELFYRHPSEYSCERTLAEECPLLPQVVTTEE